MVRVKRSRRTNAPLDPLRVMARHLFAVFTVATVFCCVSVYFFFLNVEERNARDGNTLSMMVAAHSAQRILISGRPYLVYGTAWKETRTAELVSRAIHSGFRFIDTACQPKHYNEAGVGEGWTTAAKELNLGRSDLFLQTKFTPFSGQDPNRLPYNPDDSLPEQVKTSLQVSLQNLQTNYLDSLVLHSPLHTLEETMEVWQTMESFVDEGKVKQLGISNCYDFEFFQSLYEQARIKPKVLQNRFHKETNFDTALRAFCQEHGVTYQSFWTLTANRHALASPEIKEWAMRMKLTPQQLMFAFLMSLGYITPLSGTTSVEHMAQDVAIMERMEGGETFFADHDELRRFAQLLGMPML